MWKFAVLCCMAAKYMYYRKVKCQRKKKGTEGGAPVYGP